MHLPRKLEATCRTYEQMRKRGIKVVIGGDYGFKITPMGQNARDIGHFVKFFGYSPAEALRCATAVGGELMGHKGELGVIKPGALADMLLVDGNPLVDQSVLVGPDRLAMIMKDGKMHRDPRGRRARRRSASRRNRGVGAVWRGRNSVGASGARARNARHHQDVSRRAGARRRQLRLRARRGSRALRRERRRKIDADQDPRRRLSARRRNASGSMGGRSHFRTRSPRAAQGVSIIHQELSLLPHRSVAENIFLGVEPTRFGILDRRTMRDEAGRLLRRLGSSIAPDSLAGDLSIAHQQIVEIAKALAIDARILVMDEPTAALDRVDARPSARSRAQAQRRGRDDRLHLAPDGRDSGGRRPRHRAQGRAHGHDRSARGSADRPARSRDGRPRSRRLLSAAFVAASRSAGARRSRRGQRAVCTTSSFERPGGRNRRRRRPRRLGQGRARLAPSSATSRSRAGRWRSAGGRRKPETSARRDRGRHRPPVG